MFGINFFYDFLHVKPPALSPAAAAFASGLYKSGYFFRFLKVIEITSGLFLLLNRFTAFFLLVLLPITVNIFMYHFMLAPYGIPVGATVLVLNLFLCIGYRKYYASVFTVAPKV